MTANDPKVYIVDDDRDIRRSLSRALQKRGFDVEAFDSAQAFLSAYTPDRTGCLVLDYGMPDMNGLELQAELLRRNHTIPIIFITGHGGVPESVQAMKAGAIDFLEKPFRQNVLDERIRSAFETHDKRRERDQIITQARLDFGTLTDREKEIASLMVAQPSDASSKMIARRLDISHRTVDHHRARILEKMHIRSIAELVDLSSKAKLFEPDGI